MSPFSFPGSTRLNPLSDLVARLAASEAFLQAANGSSVYSMGQAQAEAQLLRQAREALLQSETRFRALLENNADVITLLAADGTILYDSPAVLTVMGYRQMELAGQNVFAHVDTEHLSEGREALARLLAGPGSSVSLTLRCRHKNGGYRWVEATGTNLLHESAVKAIVVNYRDVTERVVAEGALRESAAFTADILNSLTAHVVVLDPQGTIIAVNEAWRNYARDNGVTATDFLGHNYLAACAVGAGQDYGVGADEAREGIRAVLDGTRPSFSLEYACHSPSQERWFLMRVSPLSGAQRGVVLTHSNITDRKHLEEQLRQSQKMEAIGQLAAGVAHDFNNLLTVIKGHIGLLRIKDRIAPEIKGSVQQIDEAADRASKLTRQLLTFSRQQALQPAEHNLNTLATGLTRMLGRILGEHINLTVDCAVVPLLIRADEGMVEQVLLNLAVNARDAMPKGGKLGITTGRADFDSAAERDQAPARSGPFVWLAVSDTGTGIAPEILPRIFEPFFTTKEVGKGTGLGLATVYSIMQQHGGWVTVESKVGQGTTFRAYFPQVTATTAKAPAASLAAHLPGGHEGILLVEDELTVRVAAEQTLTDLGYRVFSAASALPALQLWEEHQHRIDLLLTDLVMPDGINGRELAQRLQTHERALPVIYMSGYSHEAAGRDFPLKEGQNYLSKPFDVTALAKIVRASLDRRNTKDPFPAIAV